MTVKAKRKPTSYRAELWQGGLMVAYVEASTPAQRDREIQHYAFMYGPDGPVEIKIKRSKT